LGPEQALEGKDCEFVVPYGVWHRQGRKLTPSYLKEMREAMVELSEEDLSALRRALWMYRDAHDRLGYFTSTFRDASVWKHADACAENLFALEKELGVCVISYWHFAQHFVPFDKELAPPLPDWKEEKWPKMEGPVELRKTEGPKEKSLVEMWTSFREVNKKHRVGTLLRCYKTRYGFEKCLIQNCFVKHN
jgi:hypothetical protein